MSALVSILAIGGFLCLFRIYQGPSISDRAVGVDIMGILFVGITGLSALFYDLPYLIDLSISLALFSFIGTIALAKYLEKRSLDD
ncbi:MAG: monovalent cation/H+ antiporter complex subunit F [candidate division WOR-3 bacterium]|jgi:multicomponent Na+:H+ antiporter subunit F|nr:monovalent cation/H+ antiporter complex subunit F [candidate division WOR-3 bacterium]